MQQTFSHDYMKDNCGCYSEVQLMQCSFMQKDTVLLEDIISSEIPLKDKYWFVCKKLATKEQNQQIAISVAEIVLPIFEKCYPDDKRPRLAIEAAKQYIAGHISLDKLIEARHVAYAAAAADAAADAAAAYDDAIKQQLLDYLKSFCLTTTE